MLVAESNGALATWGKRAAALYDQRCSAPPPSDLPPALKEGEWFERRDDAEPTDGLTLTTTDTNTDVHTDGLSSRTWPMAKAPVAVVPEPESEGEEKSA